MVFFVGNNEWNVIMWMDHRAETEAAEINKTNHEVLKYSGGVMSLEMQTPKLKWLKNVNQIIIIIIITIVCILIVLMM